MLPADSADLVTVSVIRPFLEALVCGSLFALLLAFLPPAWLVGQPPPAHSRASPGTQAQPNAQAPAAAPHQEPPKFEEESETEKDESESEEEAPAETQGLSVPSRSANPREEEGNAIDRQAASIQRQLGRAQGQRSQFFVFGWLSDSPLPQPSEVADAAATSPPEDCEPLDKTIADAYIRDSATREGVSMDLVREVIRKESAFNPCAVSPKGAMGMMQLMPDTAQSLGVSDPFDPRQNIGAGVRHLKRLIDKYNGRPDLALAAYNAGEGAVDANNGVPAYRETQEYVSTIMKRVFEEKAKPNTPHPIEPITVIRVPGRPPKAPTAPSAPAQPGP